MFASTNDLIFNDCIGGKRIGNDTHIAGNGLKNKNAKDIVVPEKYLGVKVVEIGINAFQGTNIESIFISRYVKTIKNAAFYECRSLKYITFDDNSELEILEEHIIGFGKIESLNLPASLKTGPSDEPSFYFTSTLNCGSYFGSNDLSSFHLFHAPTLSSSFVVHSFPDYPYTIGSLTPVGDGVKCPEKKFNIKKQIDNVCSCRYILYTNTFLSKIIIISLLSS